MSDLRKQNSSTIKQLNDSHAREVARLNKDREELRSMKDDKIRNLETAMDQQRSRNELEINRQIVVIRE